MSWEIGIALATLVLALFGSIGTHIFLMAQWKKQMEMSIKRESERIDHLYNRDDRIYNTLDEIKECVTKIRIWIAGQEGRLSSKVDT